MKHVILFLGAFFLLAPISQAQTNTSEYVYTIFQSRCGSCHSNASPAGNLDLEGAGATAAAKMADVYSKTFDKASHNATSAGEGYKIIYPGNAWRSTIFRKINAGLQPNMVLEPGEGDDHSNASHTITDVEKETIRQWLLFGAPGSGEVVDVPMLQRYYSGQAVPSFTTPPPAPDPSEGFQIHLGPFFLEEDGEEEFFWKYPTELAQDVEVYKIEALFGPYSHHFLLMDFHPGLQVFKNEGLRSDNAHSFTNLVTVQQFSDTLDLPQGSAFFWEAGTVLDLNTHYINYTNDKVAGCEVYVNIYTQPKGTAIQEMKVALEANTSIVIPANAQTVSFSEDVVDAGNTNNVYLWALTTHTHKYGTDFDVFSRDVFGNKNDHIFDAEYMNGDPNGLFIGYDYQHPPIRYYRDFLPIKGNEGLTYEASYVNTGTQTVRWGDTSDDEMMVLVFFYLDDTTGVSTGDPTTAIDKNLYGNAEISIAPNPMQTSGAMHINAVNVSRVNLEIFDIWGKKVQEYAGIPVSPNSPNSIQITRNGLPAGLYVCKLTNETGENIKTAKLFIQ